MAQKGIEVNCDEERAEKAVSRQPPRQVVDEQAQTSVAPEGVMATHARPFLNFTIDCTEQNCLHTPQRNQGGAE
jgi:hypothetical protein